MLNRVSGYLLLNIGQVFFTAGVYFTNITMPVKFFAAQILARNHNFSEMCLSQTKDYGIVKSE